ncbi:hypothetical protein HY086_04070 [Candidatus Gottesmanbacteria bacterium]|nr:hypothetical protein [Candidatus Gottesmanbacteria bacterium]
MVRFLLLFIFAFGLGFGVCYFFVSPNNRFSSGQALLEKANVKEHQVLGESTADQFITYVTYQDGRFNPSHVVVAKGNYLAITNGSPKELLWLISDLPILTTVRGYAHGERLQTILGISGSYTVTNKLSPNHTLTISVQ